MHLRRIGTNCRKRSPAASCAAACSNTAGSPAVAQGSDGIAEVRMAARLSITEPLQSLLAAQLGIVAKQLLAQCAHHMYLTSDPASLHQPTEQCTLKVYEAPSAGSTRRSHREVPCGTSKAA